MNGTPSICPVNPNLPSALQLRTLLRLALGLVLLVAALAKLTHVAEFVRILAVQPLLQWGGWQPLAMLLPAVELVVGSRLVLGAAGDDTAARASLALFAVFFAYQLAVAGQTGFAGRPASSCPCFTFGSTAPLPQYVYVLRNAGFLGLAIASVLGSRSKNLRA
jgi:hypothetical protein